MSTVIAPAVPPAVTPDVKRVAAIVWIRVQMERLGITVEEIEAALAAAAPVAGSMSEATAVEAEAGPAPAAEPVLKPPVERVERAAGPAAARPATTLVVEPIGPAPGLLPAAPVTAPPMATPRQQRKKRLGQHAANAQAALAGPAAARQSAAATAASAQPEAGQPTERPTERPDERNGEQKGEQKDEQQGEQKAEAKGDPAPAAPAGAARRYRNAEGQVWDGEGAMPSWLVRAVNAGQSVEHFRVS